MKTVFSRKNAIVRQFIRSAIRDWAVCRIGALCPSSRPATTTLTTPEECSSSETMNVANGTTNEIAVSRTGSVTCLRTFATTRNAANPISGAADRRPPGSRRRRATSRRCRRPAAMAVRSATSAVASLKSDSPSRIVTIRRGRPIRRPIDGGGDRVRGRDDGADRERRPPVDAGQQRVHEPADAEGREDDEADAEQEDRAPVGVEVDERGLDRGGVEQRRQQAEQHDIGGEVDRRHAGDVGHDDADDDQPERRREADALGQRRAGEHRDRQRDQQERDLHRGHCVRSVAQCAAAPPSAWDLPSPARRCRAAPGPSRRASVGTPRR